MGVCRFRMPDKTFGECGGDIIEGELCVEHQPDKMVNHPAHYGSGLVHEVYRCLEAWGLTGNAYLWNVVKYIARAGNKGSFLEDLKKARWYLDREIERREKTP